FFAEKGRLIEPGKALSAPLGREGWAYQILCPVTRSGMALIGDVGVFVTRGRKRIASIDDQTDELKAKILFATDEQALTIAAYSPRKPGVRVSGGTCKDLAYDATSGIALARIVVDATTRADVMDGDPVKQVEISFRPGTTP